MVILGLGSNVGDRLANCRNAVEHIKKIAGVHLEQISPLYLSDAMLPDNSPPEWDKPHLNLALRCECQLAPLALLHALKKIESLIGRKSEGKHWGPRLIDIDILAWDEVVIDNETLTIPHKGLAERPFALWPLADVAPTWVFPFSNNETAITAAQMVEKWGSRFTGDAPFRTRQLSQRLATPQLVGIINITPDSFSDGGQFLDVEKAVAHAHALMQAGAEILDIGAESTAPRAHCLDAKTEWSRLEPIITAIKASQSEFILRPKISIDTRHAETANKALMLGVDWINDVTGLQDAAMRDVIALSKTDCVVMHHLSIPASREHVLPRREDAIALVYEWGARQLETLEKCGIMRDNIIFDPGIGFGKVPEQSLALIKHISVLKQWGTRLLVGHSRKSFLSLFTAAEPQERDIETLAISLYLAKEGVDYLRLHNVELCARGLRVVDALL